MTKRDDDGFTRRDLLSIGGAAGGALIATGLGSRALAEEAGAKGGQGLPQVPKRRLGRTKESVPILLFGCAVELDSRFDPKLAEAYRFGVSYYDTADCYGGGSSENAVGAVVERMKSRDKVWITSKSDAHDPDGLEDTLKKGLAKLRTSYVDMYYLHAVNDGDVFTSDLAKRVERLKKEGRMKYFGFSCHGGNVVELLNKASTLSWIDSVMFRYNFRKYGDKELNLAMDACAKVGVGLIAMKTQGAEASFRDAWKKFEKTGKWNKYQAVLKAVWADERITAAVSHMDSLEKLKENVAAALDKSELGVLERDALRKYAEATRAYACDGCDHLCGAAVDAPVRIGDTMRFLMYHDVYGETEKAKVLFSRLPEAARKLAGLDFSKAAAACPNALDLPAHMTRAAEIFTA